MKITLCGSIAFLDEMKKLTDELASHGHEVRIPDIDNIRDDNGKSLTLEDFYNIRKNPDTDDVWVWDCKEKAINRHFEKIDWADAILVANYDKKGIKNYIGGNTLIEIGLAFYQKKPIFLLQTIPDIDYREEVHGMKPIIINGDLSLLVV